MKKPVIVISSHVARGSVGNRAAVFALEVLGHPVWAVPTITLPYHPGHGPATRIIPEHQQFKSFLNDLAVSRWIGEVGGILTGYMADEAQVEIVSDFVSTVKANYPTVIHVCDPVMGDGVIGGDGRLYVSEGTATAMRDRLVPVSDTATPNRFELSWLTGKTINTHTEAIDAARLLAPQTVLVTSMPGYMHGNIGNLLVNKPSAFFAEHRKLDNPPNGPGDLTAALLLSHLVDGLDHEKALQRLTASVFEIVAGAAKRGADELMLESDADAIRRPMAMVTMRSVAETTKLKGKRKKIFKPSSL